MGATVWLHGTSLLATPPTRVGDCRGAGVRFPAVGAGGSLAVPGLPHVTVGLVIASDPVDRRKPVTDPRTAVVLCPVLKHTQFADHRLQCFGRVGVPRIDQGLRQRVGSGVDDDIQRSGIVFQEGSHDQP